MEIVAGHGTAARFGNVAIWAGPGASELLVTFLVESARNVGTSPLGGARIADHIGSVLAGRDPEPGVPFACVGPDQAGTVILLHGAIQAWDGTRWLVPQPRPGWLRTAVAAAVPYLRDRSRGGLRANDPRFGPADGRGPRRRVRPGPGTRPCRRHHRAPGDRAGPVFAGRIAGAHTFVGGAFVGRFGGGVVGAGVGAWVCAGERWRAWAGGPWRARGGAGSLCDFLGRAGQ